MELHRIQDAYKELPEELRGRWDFERFRVLSEERCNANVAFDVHAKPPREAQKNEFGGLASAFGVEIDSWMPTFIEPGSFKNTLANKAERARVKVLFEHSMLIGVPTLLEEHEKGLMVMGKVSETTLGNDVLILLRDGALDEMSIGFDPVEYHYKEDKQKRMCRHITEARLWEFSAVSFGANRGAKITVVNSALVNGSERVDLDKLASLIGERLGRFAPRVDEQNPEAVRAEIARLSKLLPVEALGGATAAELARLDQIGRAIQ